MRIGQRVKERLKMITERVESTVGDWADRMNEMKEDSERRDTKEE